MAGFRRLWLVLAFLVLMWLLFRASGLAATFDLQHLQDGFVQHRWAGLLIFVALFALGNLLQIPGSVFLVSAVLALGQVWGGIATYVAASATCISTFLVIRWLGADSLRGLNGKLAQRIFAHLDTHPVRSVALLRLLFQTVPALNYALALSGIRFRSYLVGTLLGLPMPIAVYCIFFGTLARWLHWPIPHGT